MPEGAGWVDEVIELPAPAKLNLFLHVVGQRADGYHELQTVFQFVGLADRVSIARRTDTLLRRTTATPGVAEAADLVIRAAQLLRDEFGDRQGCGYRCREADSARWRSRRGEQRCGVYPRRSQPDMGSRPGLGATGGAGAEAGSGRAGVRSRCGSVGRGRGRASGSSRSEQPWYVLVVLPFAVSTADVLPRARVDTKYPQNQNEQPASRSVRNTGIAGTDRAYTRLGSQ